VWLDPQGIVIPGTDTLQVSPAMLAQSGSWRALAIINGCPGDTSAGFHVSIDTGIVIDIVAPLRACGGETITLSIMPQATGTYAWSGPGGFVSTDPSPDVLAMAGTYAVTLLTATGCEATDTHDIAVDEQPSITAVLTDSDTCVDGITPIILFVISEPAFDPAFTYQWLGPSGFTVQDSSIVLTETTAAASGIYSVVIENGACVSDTASIELVLRDIPATPLIEGLTQYCDGDTIRLSIGNPVAGTDYAWTSADTSVTLQSPGTLVIPNASSAWSGTYAVTAITVGCTSPIASVDIIVNESLAAAVITAPSLVCEGDTLFLSATLPPGASASWTGPNGWTSTEAEPFIHPFTANEAGAYAVTYALGDCVAPASVPHIVDLQGVITPPMLTGDITAICLDAPVPIDLCIAPATATPGGMYTLWLNDQFVLAGPTPDSCFLLTGAGLIPGTNNLSVIASLNGCDSDPGEAYVVQGDNYPTQMADAGLPMTYCPDEPFTLEGSDPAPGTGQWTSDDPNVVFTDPADPNTTVNGLPSGNYAFEWTLSFASCTNYSTDLVQIEVLRPPASVDDTVQVDFGRTTEFIVTLNDSIGGIPYTLVVVQPPVRGNALHAGNGVFRYSPNVGYVGPDSLVYRICAAECPDACSEAVVRIQVGDETDCFVPTLFTPNGDGVNDVLIIPCLETTRYPNNAIKVFNEWGGLVFTAAPYGNDWMGTHDGKALPVGTYFYIMDFGDGSAPKRTFLVLER
jgi:gliding motility-associated-like protein